VREGACGKRTAATPKPRPQAYLTPLHLERPIPNAMGFRAKRCGGASPVGYGG